MLSDGLHLVPQKEGKDALEGGTLTRISPTKRTLINPIGMGVERASDGTTILSFLISPIEVVSVTLGEESRRALVRELTGGVAVP